MALKSKYSIEYIKNNNLILLECISGSIAYGTNIETSDTDIRGVFYLEKNDFLGLDTIDEISDNKQDIKYFELKKFLTLCASNNPNIMELLNAPSDCILIKNDLMDKIKPEYFLSKKCKNSFGGYAISQIKKARGLNKKIVNPVNLDNKKSILDFASILHGKKEESLKHWLNENNVKQNYCGIVNIDAKRDLYRFYCDWKAVKEQKINSSILKGLLKEEQHTIFLLSSIPKEVENEMFVGYLYYNQDSYKTYLKDYDDYKTWVNERNESRYLETIKHGMQVDCKNLMHCVRLLDMAKEIAELKQVIVKRPNRNYLLDIRNGKFDYDYLVNKAEESLKGLDVIYEKSNLPLEPDFEKINTLHKELRKALYMI